ncbi:uncharacterized protein [Haliotis cracherodii]|uniref:uncharacterized protein n=1 Tax=Haliotis cracherodii TaxID=6455 RepID=UPI0039EC45C9
MISVFVISVGLLGLALGQDQTRVPGTSGEEVVEAVVSRIRESCTFSHDKLFLRRLAYVETHDGTDAKTYRPGYDGGIWQIDESKFIITKASSSARALFPKITSRFGIDWNITNWADLRKPIFSGLAAALYLATLTEDIPQRTKDQATFYQRHFRNDTQSVHNFSEGSKRFDTVCQRTNLDLAFLVDASSSLAPEDFRKAKQFAQNVVKNFKIGRNDVRIALVTFSSGYKSQFDFNQYTNNADVHEAIDQVLKSEGPTDTDQALDYASETLFTKYSGSREGSSKVILLVTDGKSTAPKKTLPAAIRTRNKGITIFAIGVGGDVDTDELRHLANKPECTHVVTLTGYGELSSLVGEIQEVSCKAPAVLTRGRYVYPCLNSGLYQIDSNGSTTQVMIAVTDGAVSVYGSVINPTPNQAGHDFYSISVPATPTVVVIDTEHRPLYLNITASGPANGCSGNYTINIGNVERANLSTSVLCVHHDVARVCSVVDFYRNFFTVVEPPYTISNPCLMGKPGFQAHPTDQTKFIICGPNGIDNVFQCHKHHIYDQNIMDCIVGEPSTTTSTTTRTPASTTIAAPTTSTNPPSQPATTMKITTFPPTRPSTSMPATTSTTFTTITATTITASTTTIKPPTESTPPSHRVTTKMNPTFSSTSTTTTTTTTSIPATSPATSSTPPETTTPIIKSSRRSHILSVGTKPAAIPTTTIKAHPDVASTRRPSTATSYSTSVRPSIHSPSTHPCTDETKGHLIPYPQDETKYIDCFIWPNVGYVMTCQQGKIWDQSILTCIYKYVIVDPNKMTVDKNVHNPCQRNLHEGDLFYYPHPDKDKFIQCDQYGDAFVKVCPKGEAWHQATLQCVPNGF